MSVLAVFSILFYFWVFSMKPRNQYNILVVSQTNIRGNIQYDKQPTYQATHTVWTGEVPGGLHPLHSSWETVNSLAGGDKVYFYHSRQTEETHWQADAQVEASERDDQTGSQADRQADGDTANQVDRQAGGRRCKQTGWQRENRGRKPAGEEYQCSLHISTLAVCALPYKVLVFFKISI